MKHKIIGIGEVLWDVLPDGRRLGGAPGNFAYHVASLGANASVISRVGDDPLGHEILERLTGLGLATDGIEIDPGAPTGVATVELGTDGQPTFTIKENVAWDYLDGRSCLGVVTDAAAVCFGTLAQRSKQTRDAIRLLVGSTPPDALRIFDINLRQNYFSREIIEQSLGLANVLKLSESELRYVCGEFSLTGSDRSQLAQLADRYNLRAVALTRGEHGCILFSDGHFAEHPGLQTVVVDTIGAGDSFTASLAMGLLFRWSLEQISNIASEVAAFVCSRSGATPTLPSHLRNLFSVQKSP